MGTILLSRSQTPVEVVLVEVVLGEVHHIGFSSSVAAGAELELVAAERSLAGPITRCL